MEGESLELQKQVQEADQERCLFILLAGFVRDTIRADTIRVATIRVAYRGAGVENCRTKVGVVGAEVGELGGGGGVGEGWELERGWWWLQT